MQDVAVDQPGHGPQRDADHEQDAADPTSAAARDVAAEHGSWNRARRTGYKVIRIPLRDGQPTGEYEDFLVGFVTPDGDVWGRPVGVAVAKDGALMVTDDGSGTVWRVAFTGRAKPAGGQ